MLVGNNKQQYRETILDNCVIVYELIRLDKDEGLIISQLRRQSRNNPLKQIYKVYLLITLHLAGLIIGTCCLGARNDSVLDKPNKNL